MEDQNTNNSKVNKRMAYGKKIQIQIKKKSSCPQCGLINYIPIIFGKGLSREDMKKRERGEIMWGGCCCMGKYKWCKNCKINY